MHAKEWKSVFLIVLMILSRQCAMAQEENSQSKSESTRVTTQHRVAGNIVDWAGKPIREALVVVQVFEYGVGLSYVDTETNSEGHFELDYSELMNKPRVPDVFLWISSPSHELRCVRPSYLDSDRKLAINLALRAAESVSVRFQGADARTAVEPYLVDVPNGVFDSDQSTGLHMLIPDLIRSNLARKLDAGGNAKLNGVRLDINDRLRVINGDGLTFETAPEVNQGFDFQFPQTGTLRGHIKNFPKKPAEPIWVTSQFSRWESTRKCDIDEHGDFVALGLVPGRATVDLKWNPQSQWQPEPFIFPKVVANQTTELEINLVQGTALSGQVRTEDSLEPIKNAKLALRCSYDTQSTGASYSLETDDAGRFSAYLAPGEWSLQVHDIGQWREGYNYPPIEKFTVRDQESKVDLGAIELSPQATETGEVVDEQGNPVAGRWIAYITARQGHLTRYAQTDDAGKFKTRVFGVQKPDSSPYWVIYPMGEKKGAIDPRTLPKLEVEESNPWRLRYKQKR